jgi:hypothetical protein
MVTALAAGFAAGAAKGQSPAPSATESSAAKGAAAVPLFRDPVHDGAADPVVVWNRARKTWWMLYTNRRADLNDGSGVTWVHGTHIGIAESVDGGAHWKYVSEADIPLPQPDYTLWAPEVIDVNGTSHVPDCCARDVYRLEPPATYLAFDQQGSAALEASGECEP